MRKVHVRVERIENHDGYYKVRYSYEEDANRNPPPLYSLRVYAEDELSALVRFRQQMKEVNYEVVTDE